MIQQQTTKQQQNNSKKRGESLPHHHNKSISDIQPVRSSQILGGNIDSAELLEKHMRNQITTLETGGELINTNETFDNQKTHASITNLSKNTNMPNNIIIQGQSHQNSSIDKQRRQISNFKMNQSEVVNNTM
jgi:inhibitor of KinA sporulation pathway (predicted exonuclease)